MLLDLRSWLGPGDTGFQARVALPGLFVGRPRKVFSEGARPRVVPGPGERGSGFSAILRK